MTEAVILVPGIMGSELYHGQDLVWPGSAFELLFPYSKMNELLDPNLRVGDIIRSVSISEQYQSLVTALGLCGFHEDVKTPTLLVCPYDWRKDNRLSADLLADKVDVLHAAHGEDLAINIVAHSMGGLVARYYLESGKYIGRKGFSSVRRLVTIGTPHRGAPLALCAALGQIKRLFLNKHQVKQIAEKPEFPSLYQLIPPANEPFLWNSDPLARLEPRDPYAAKAAQALGLNAQNLAAATSFHASLDVTRKPKHVTYFCFVGTRQETICNVRAVFSVPGGAGARAPDPVGIEVDDGGDGTVPSWSASFAGMQQLAVGGDHGSLYKVPEVLSTLGTLLGKAGVLSSKINPEHIRISARDEVVSPETNEPVALFFNTPRLSLEADLVVRKLTGSNGQKIVPPEIVAKYPLAFKGAPVDSLALTIVTPEYAGVYELDLLGGGESKAENTPKLMVQQDEP
ncbi:lipase/acyltransferase domain-containing protein [Luteibacter jiangsuensis]